MNDNLDEFEREIQAPSVVLVPIIYYTIIREGLKTSSIICLQNAIFMIGNCGAYTMDI